MPSPLEVARVSSGLVGRDAREAKPGPVGDGASPAVRRFHNFAAWSSPAVAKRFPSELKATPSR